MAGQKPIVKGRIINPVVDVSINEGSASIRVDSEYDPAFWMELHFTEQMLEELLSEVKKTRSDRFTVHWLADGPITENFKTKEEALERVRQLKMDRHLAEYVGHFRDNEDGSCTEYLGQD